MNILGKINTFVFPSAHENGIIADWVSLAGLLWKRPETTRQKVLLFSGKLGRLCGVMLRMPDSEWRITDMIAGNQKHSAVFPFSFLFLSKRVRKIMERVINNQAENIILLSE